MASQGLHEVLEKESIVRVHHISKTYWTPVGVSLTNKAWQGGLNSRPGLYSLCNSC